MQLHGVSSDDHLDLRRRRTIQPQNRQTRITRATPEI